MEAKFHSLETMGSVDGPGLRFVLFLQGCNMKCLYCHNRDTWSSKAGNVISLEELVKKINSLKGFYIRDNGGITVSGGEPLLQSVFLKELFKEVHDLGLTTAVDTSGHVELTDSVKEVVDSCDYLLMDVKSLKDDIHKKLVGVDRNLVNSFFTYVKESKVKVWLRYVVVPGYTDSKEDIESLADFINGFKNIERVDLLPYHEYGKEKWEQLGYKYPLEGLKPPKAELMSGFRSYLTEHCKVIVK